MFDALYYYTKIEQHSNANILKTYVKIEQHSNENILKTFVNVYFNIL